jgi:3-hydroxymyristoyl/3-hydroxydecanoyl-(acyl carrier protein) dehydratase
MAFCFVDRITALCSDRACGQLRRAAAAAPLPPWLVIEAVGQLAAWIAIVRSDFGSRPVAAAVGEVRLDGTDTGGGVDLEARIDRLDSRAVLYSGTARVDGAAIAVLERCVGPLLPMQMFDDPRVVRERLAALRAGWPATGAGGVEGEIPSAQPSSVELRDGKAQAQLRVPESAPYFADHFPRRPVYPAALLADAQNQLARGLAARALGVGPEHVQLSRVRDFKVRSFSPPGQVLDLLAEPLPTSDGSAVLGASVSAAGKRIGSCVLEYRLTRPRAA